VVIVAHRYDWVPNDPSNLDAKSITWLECEHACNVTRKVLAFLVLYRLCNPASVMCITGACAASFAVAQRERTPMPPASVRSPPTKTSSRSGIDLLYPQT
jgi:hypothetical protein